MKLLILLVVLVAFVTNVEVVKTFTPVYFQQSTNSNSFHKEISEAVFQIIENDLEIVAKMSKI